MHDADTPYTGLVPHGALSTPYKGEVNVGDRCICGNQFF